MIHLDGTLPDDVVRQFASQIPHIPPGVRSLLDNSFTDDETPDFYRGLLTGMANTYQLSKLPKDFDATVGCALAIVATKVLNTQGK